MFEGTVIEQLFAIVERAEDHAHTVEMKSDSNSDLMYQGFMAEVAKSNQVWLGVA